MIMHAQTGGATRYVAPRLIGIQLAGAAFSAALAAPAALACAKPPALGQPLRDLSQSQREQFEQGKVAFTRTFAPEDGLGPLFNSTSCSECHETPATGGVGDEIETHGTVLRPDGTCDLLLDKGGFVFQLHTTPALKKATGLDAAPIPAEAKVHAHRTTPSLFGFGLLDAVPESEILERADPDDKNGDGISGRPNRFTDGRLGRFGRKAFVPTLLDFTEGAYLIEQGITNPAMPQEISIGGKPIPPGVDPVPDPEITAEVVGVTNAFLRFLAPPSPMGVTAESRRGEGIFERVGCVACHVPRLRTGGDHFEKALRHKTVAAYTDLLLHDMGPDLADICLGLATPSEFRTEPLMGLRFREHFLHDGRATTIDAAIRAHAGEATASRDRFNTLPDPDRKALLAFLGTL
jgi:CxxC motif-containing protein (DUF1111 family)